MKIKSQGTQLILSLIFGVLASFYVGFAEFLLCVIAFCLMNFVLDFDIILTHSLIACLNAYMLKLRNERVRNEPI